MPLLIYALEDYRLLGECALEPPSSPFLVIRVVDGEGAYRRLKFPVVEQDGVRAIASDTLDKARLLPGFRPAPGLAGQPAAAAVPAPPPLPHAGLLHHHREWLDSLGQLAGSLDLRAQVLVRLLARLDEVKVTAPHPLHLAPGELVGVVVALPPLPAGNLFLRPAPGLPLALPLVLERATLGATAAEVTLPLQAQEQPLSLPAGAPLGVIEVRSPSELPEGMREKIFQSHFESRLQEANRAAAQV